LNLPGNKAFCDTSFFFASLCPHDTNFEKAGKILEYCKDNAVTLCTTWDIISETITLLRYRANYKVAVEFLDTVKPALFIVRYDDSIRIAAEDIFKKLSRDKKFSFCDSIRIAAEDIFKKLSRDKKFSFCDAISYVLITYLLEGMPCFTFDKDFRNLGLLVYP